MYTLGDWNRALVRLVSPDGRQQVKFELVRADGQLQVRLGREGPLFFRVKLYDSGDLTVEGEQHRLVGSEFIPPGTLVLGKALVRAKKGAKP